jgi:hypothetical protein
MMQRGKLTFHFLECCPKTVNRHFRLPCVNQLQSKLISKDDKFVICRIHYTLVATDKSNSSPRVRQTLVCKLITAL